MEEKKTCFIITPIGEEGSETRKHIDGVIKGAVNPALQNKYYIIPPHEINQIGSITDDVLNYLRTSDLVVANLTGLNPNVMYELGYRHCAGKPVIAIAEKGTKPPFDIQNDRTFYYEYSVEGIAKLREQLVEVEGNIVFDKPPIPNPIPPQIVKSAYYVFIERHYVFYFGIVLLISFAVLSFLISIFCAALSCLILFLLYAFCTTTMNEEIEKKMCKLFSQNYKAEATFLVFTLDNVTFSVSFPENCYLDDVQKLVESVVEAVGLKYDSMRIS